MDHIANEEKKVDWDRAKICLARLYDLAPEILQQGMVIGRIADIKSPRKGPLKKKPSTAEGLNP